MIDYQYLVSYPDLFPAVLEINLSHYQSILKRFIPVLHQAQLKKALGHSQVREIGGVHPYKSKTDEEKLFFILFRYKVYPTFRLTQAIILINLHTNDVPIFLSLPPNLVKFDWIKSINGTK